MRMASAVSTRMSQNHSAVCPCITSLVVPSSHVAVGENKRPSVTVTHSDSGVSSTTTSSGTSPVLAARTRRRSSTGKTLSRRSMSAAKSLKGSSGAAHESGGGSLASASASHWKAHSLPKQLKPGSRMTTEAASSSAHVKPSSPVGRQSEAPSTVAVLLTGPQAGSASNGIVALNAIVKVEPGFSAESPQSANGSQSKGRPSTLKPAGTPSRGAAPQSTPSTENVTLPVGTMQAP